MNSLTVMVKAIDKLCKRAVIVMNKRTIFCRQKADVRNRWLKGRGSQRNPKMNKGKTPNYFLYSDLSMT